MWSNPAWVPTRWDLCGPWESLPARTCVAPDGEVAINDLILEWKYANWKEILRNFSKNLTARSEPNMEIMGDKEENKEASPINLCSVFSEFSISFRFLYPVFSHFFQVYNF